MKLSIIIPIYKVEKYIEHCLYSIYDQKIDEFLFEVIAVNDGTPDNSMNIVKKYANKHKNLHVLNYENQGLSIARNLGLKKASGDYVWFVDSDDWLTNNSLSIVISHLSKNYDVLKIKLCRINESNGKSTIDSYNKYLKNKDVIVGSDFLFADGAYAPAQSFIFNRYFLQKNNLVFFPGIYHEDGEFGMRTLYLAKSIKLLNNICYNYRLREGSIMSSFKLKNFQDLIIIYNNMIEFGNKYVKTEDIKHWRGLTVHFIYIFFHWAKSSKFEKNNSSQYWQLYYENKALFNLRLKDIFYRKHFHKSNLKDFLILRFFTKLFFHNR